MELIQTSKNSIFVELKVFLRPYYVILAQLFPHTVISMLKVILIFDPCSPALNSLIGYAYFRLDRLDKAKECWDHTFASHHPKGAWQNWTINEYILCLAFYKDEKRISRLMSLSNAEKLLQSLKQSKQIERLALASYATKDKIASNDFAQFINQMGLEVKTVVPANEIAEEYQKISEAHPISILEPQVWNEKETLPKSVDVPEQFVAKLRNVFVVGAFQVVKEEKFILYEPASHPKIGTSVAGVWKYFTWLPSLGPDKIVCTRAHKDIVRHKVGILISGRATGNYFHWLIEYVPKVLNVNKAKLDISIPLVIQKGLPTQFLQALKCVAPGRPILEASPDSETLAFETLYVVSVHTYIPDNFSIPYWMGGAYSSDHMRFVRDSVNNCLSDHGHSTSSGNHSRKIYLARSGVRSIRNSQSIEKMIRAKGFEIIRPEKLTFLEQVKIFKEAKIIVAPGGAALSNLIFCEPGTKVICMVSERNKHFCAHSNLAHFAKCSFIHVPGPNLKPRNKHRSEDDFVHSSFEIDLKKLKDCIEKATDSKPELDR